MNVVQLTDTHVVPRGERHFGIDTAAYLADAIAAANALDPQPAYAVVTGDLVDRGTRAEYEHFREIMTSLRCPYYVIPGNHDDRERLREVLAPETYGHSRHPTIRYAIDRGGLRFIGLDANRSRPAPGARLDAETLAWLDETLASEPQRPTIVGVHQPPFRTGLHYLDVFGFRGRSALRSLVERHRNVGRVISGHVHCHRSARWSHALASSIPSTAPQPIPLVFMEGTMLGLRVETPCFAVHAWNATDGFSTAYYRRRASGAYELSVA